MSLAALVAVEHLDTANETLQNLGFGPGNFSVPVYTGEEVTHYCLHAGEHISPFIDAVKLLPNVTWREYTPRIILEELCNTVGGTLTDPSEML